MRKLNVSSTISSNVHKSVESFHSLVVAARVALPWIDTVIPSWVWDHNPPMDLPYGLDHVSLPQPREKPELVSIIRPVVPDALVTDDLPYVTYDLSLRQGLRVFTK